MGDPLSTKKTSAGAEEGMIPGEKSRSSARRTKVIIGLVLVVFFALAVLYRSDFAQRQILLLRARLSNDPGQQIPLYREGLAMGESLSAQKDLVEAYAAAGQYENAGNLVQSLLGEYPDDSWLNRYKDSRTPAGPKVSAPEGTYDTDVELRFSLNGGADDPAYYGASILCYQDGEPVDLDTGAPGILLTENGTYRVTLQARNAFGFLSPRSEYTYTLNKLIPKAVEISLPGGYYWSAVQVELTQSENLRIFYTLDGTAPDSDSSVYSGPIVLESGRSVLRTAACSDQGMMGEESTSYYHIKPWSSGLEKANGSLITAHGDYCYENGSLVQYLDGTPTGVKYALSAKPAALCEYVDGILAAAGTSVVRIDLDTGESTEYAAAPDTVSAMTVFGEDLYICTASHDLYLLRDGKFEKADVKAYSIGVSREGGRIYAGGSDGIYAVRGLAAEKLLDAAESVTYLAVSDSMLFYCEGGDSIFCYDLASGQKGAVMEFHHYANRVEPNSINNGFVENTTDGYSRVCYANGLVYYYHEYAHHRATVPWYMTTMEKDPVDIAYGEWMAWNPVSGGITTIPDETIQIDDGYYRVPANGFVAVLAG